MHKFEIDFDTTNIKVEAEIENPCIGASSIISITEIDDMKISQRQELQRLRDAILRFHNRAGFINSLEISCDD